MTLCLELAIAKNTVPHVSSVICMLDCGLYLESSNRLVKFYNVDGKHKARPILNHIYKIIRMACTMRFKHIVSNGDFTSNRHNVLNAIPDFEKNLKYMICEKYFLSLYQTCLILFFYLLIIMNVSQFQY